MDGSHPMRLRRETDRSRGLRGLLLPLSGLVFLSVLVALPVAAEDPEEIYRQFADLGEVWATDRAGAAGLGIDPRTVLYRAAGDGVANRRVGVEALAETYGLPSAAAEPLFEAVLHDWKARKALRSEGYPALQAGVRAAENAYALAYEQAPDHSETGLSLLAFYDFWSRHDPELRDLLLAMVVDYGPDDPLWRFLEFRTRFQSRVDVVRQALRHDPHNPDWLELLAQGQWLIFSPQVEAAIVSVGRDLPRPDGESVMEQARALTRELTLLCDDGLWRLALERFEAADAPVRNQLLAGLDPPVATSFVGWTKRRLDLRLRLAMALALQDRIAESSALLAQLPSPVETVGRDGDMESESLAREVLTAFLSPSADEDPFDLLQRVVGFGTFHGAHDELVLRLAAEVARPAGYRDFIRYFGELLRGRRGGLGVGEDILARLPDPVHRRLSELQDQRRMRLESLDSQLAALDEDIAQPVRPDLWQGHEMKLYQLDQAGQRGVVITSREGTTTHTRLVNEQGRWVEKLSGLSIGCFGGSTQ